MERLPEFVINNWVLFLALGVLVVWIITTETTKFSFGVPQLDASQATFKYNKEEAQFVDVRAEADYRKGHLPGAINVTMSALEQKNRRLERARKKPVIVYCQTGMTSGRAARTLKKQGFEQVFTLKGGVESWQAASLPIHNR